MKFHFLKFVIGLFVLTLFVLFTAFTLAKFSSNYDCWHNFIYLAILFSGVSAVFHFLLINTVEKNPKKFVNTFLIVTVSKILIYLIFLIVYIFNISSGMKCFLLSFIGFYLSYTIFEVVMLSRYLKNKRSN
jgi:asparagine N-glycosylation enzyme membrane subunit Stt3